MPATTTAHPLGAAVATLDFARHVLATTERRRAEQLRTGTIDQEQRDADVAAARELVRLAEDEFLFGGPPLN